MDKYFEMLEMCMRLLEKIEKLQEENAKLKNTNNRLLDNLQQYQREEMRRTIVPYTYGCVPGNDEVRKEGDSK